MAKEQGVSAKKSEDFSTWYADVILKASLIEHSRVSGCMIIRPDAYSLWESIQKFLDTEFKKKGVRNVYFPLLIPEELLTKEANHVEGFAPEVAWVTHAGDSKLSERLAIRPTSETVMYDAFKKWIRSHRDLPLLLNQWCNVVRWEFNHPVPFLRTREFLWQEGHTAHAHAQSAADEVETILDIYARAFEEYFAVPVIKGKKSEKEKFAGADYTMSIETLFPNGKAIQAATSHFLGQNFAKAFDVTFLDENEKTQYVYQNSWGFTTRSIGIMIGMHGDDKGLVLPPKVAPIPVVIVPITFSKKPELSAKILGVAKTLAQNNNWHVDDRDNYSPGFKFSEWELKGIPVRIEIGPRDLEADSVTLVRRDTGEKEQVKIAHAAAKVNSLLSTIQQSLLENKRAWLNEQIQDVSSLEELNEVVLQGKLARAYWCGKDEERIKEETSAKSLNGVSAKGPCFLTGEEADMQFLFGKSY